MARKSAAALAVVSNIPGQRPEPPVTLSPRAAAEWRAVVSRMPFDWFTRETEAILCAYCSHVCQLELVRERLTDFTVESLRDEERLRIYERLSKVADAHGKALVSLGRSMRITQQSRADRKVSATAVNAVGSGRKPWDTDEKVA